MRGVNKVFLVATLGQDPETKQFPNGGVLTTFSVATSESWIDKNSGERVEQTEWHRITTHNKLAEICAQYLTKGSKVTIEGSLKTRKWQDQNGQDRYSTEIVATNIDFIETKDRENDNQGYQNKGKQNSYQGKGKQSGYQR